MSGDLFVSPQTLVRRNSKAGLAARPSVLSPAGPGCYHLRVMKTSSAALAALLLLSACGGGAPEAEPTAAPEVEATSVDEGFEAIFDGSTLDGWTLIGGQGGGYRAEDGVLLCRKGEGGNLFFDRELTDFEFRFEFQLSDGSNNGLCIRCPKQEQDLAYEGMELQIIDNASERYKDIEPWQKHGSLYHVQPAKTGALKPTGEWNEEAVTVRGRQVTIVLNGETILDVDLDSFQDPETLEKHPGLQRPAGHIGFLGHNEPIQFRNLRLREF